MKENLITRGELAKRSGIGFETVRFYENKKLIAEPIRSESGYRLYPLETIDRLNFLKRAQELGFTLKEIEGLLGLVEDESLKCSSVNKLATQKIQEVKNKISDLKKLEKVLKDLVSRCNINANLRDCPIIESLSKTKY